MWSLFISFAALIVAVVAAIFTIKTFYLKKGCKVAVQMSNCLISSDNIEPYVSQIILENRKDKEVTVYNIYVQYGEAIYLDLLHQNPNNSINRLIKPILLPPFSVKIINLGPPIAYKDGMLRVENVYELFKCKKVEIVLSTNYGKVIAENVDIWEPPFRKQDNVKIIYPIRQHYGGSNTYESPSIFTNTKFLVTITYPSGKKGYQQLLDRDLMYLFNVEQLPEDLMTVDQVKKVYGEKYKTQLPDGTKVQVEDVRDLIKRWRKNDAFGVESIDWDLS